MPLGSPCRSGFMRVFSDASCESPRPYPACPARVTAEALRTEAAARTHLGRYLEVLVLLEKLLRVLRAGARGGVRGQVELPVVVDPFQSLGREVGRALFTAEHPSRSPNPSEPRLGVRSQARSSPSKRDQFLK